TGPPELGQRTGEEARVSAGVPVVAEPRPRLNHVLEVRHRALEAAGAELGPAEIGAELGGEDGRAVTPLEPHRGLEILARAPVVARLERDVSAHAEAQAHPIPILDPPRSGDRAFGVPQRAIPLAEAVVEVGQTVERAVAI